MTKAKVKDATAEVAPQVVTKRISRNKQQINLDHFKLMVATKTIDLFATEARKDDVLQDPNFIKQEHIHFYHTFDSGGKKQTRSTSIAGHFHEITEIPQGPGLPPKIVVGPGVKEVRYKDPRTRKWSTKLAPADDNVFEVADAHTHEWEYLYSETIETRDLNTEAVALQTMEANKTAPIPGVVG